MDEIKKVNSVDRVDQLCEMDTESSKGQSNLLQNPLLFPEVLSVIFKNLNGDYRSLRSCREVSRVWNSEACKILKESNSPVFLSSSQDLQKFLIDLSKPNGQIDIFKGIIFQGPYLQIEKDDYGCSALIPPSPLLWQSFKMLLGEHITHLDISFVTLQKTEDGHIEPRRLRLSDFRKLVFVTCPNLTHLVIRELQKQFVQTPKASIEPRYKTKLKSLILKNKITNNWYYQKTDITSTSQSQRYHVPCNTFYEDLLQSCPDLEHVGFFFHLSYSSRVYLEILANNVESGALTKLKSIERVSYGTNRTQEVGTHIDSASTMDLLTSFKSIHFRCNLMFVPIQLTTSFKSSWQSVEDLNVASYYYNETNYLCAIIEFDNNLVPLPYMENLKKLCLRGGIPIEPFLLNAPNLQELVISFMGRKNRENALFTPIKFWNETWHDNRLIPMSNLWKLDVGHNVFICPHEIQTIAKLCPNVKKLAVPFRSNGCVQEVFKCLPQIEELDIILVDNESHLTDDVFYENSDNPGVGALRGLQALRIRVNEVSKLNDAVRNNFPITHLDIADSCLLTDEFIIYISNSLWNLKILQLEVGQFTDSVWNNLTRDSFTSLRFLEVPGSLSSGVTLHQMQTNLPWTNISFATFKPTKEGVDINSGGLD